MEMMDAVAISTTGMRAQGERIRIIAENMANADTTASAPGGDPYRRKTITFKSVYDKTLGAQVVATDKIAQDMKSDFRLKFAPDHPAADKNGYIKVPNVDSIIEVADMREAQRSYEANLGMVDMARNMMNRAIDLLRG